MARKDELGRAGERLAAEHLSAAGYTILERNWRCAIGEIDIVAQQGRTTVVVEVKTRSGVGFGHPLDAVTPRKLARLRRLAGAWCAAQSAAPDRGARDLRIDVIGVVAGRDGIAIDHLQQVC
ncbi:YraN family protein [Microcella sp.]|uniref:YraN family protein n=1 Tax=Microcella sp. TaxID=1913979 RepID=UPI0025689248|nr:YraN family protein [Microcella sp.]MBX9472934.1 YraN family protein [Microcella sp.]